MHHPVTQLAHGSMVEARDSVHCKRRCSVHESHSELPVKKQKGTHEVCDAQSQSPAAFWDSLSRIWLTKRALKELDRRNTQFAHQVPTLGREGEKRLTRSTLAEWKRKKQPVSLSIRDSSSIKRFARQGGPDLLDMRGYPESINLSSHAINSSQSSSRIRKRYTKSHAKSASSKKSSPYDRNFEQNLVDYGIYPKGYEHPNDRLVSVPKNWEEIKTILTQPRPSLSTSIFSDEAFRDFTPADEHTFKEVDVTASVIPIISGKTKSDKSIARDVIFGNLDPLIDGGLVPGKPDIFYGARPEQLDRHIRRELAGHIIPSSQADLPMLPNFFLEAKGPDGSLAVAGRQACYDGALGARAMRSLQSFGTEPIHDGNAYTITSIYHGGNLKLYTSHATSSESPDRSSDYHMNQLRSFAMTDCPDSFRQGARAYRNARDWAKEQRDQFVKDANTKGENTSTQGVCFETRHSGQVTISAAGAVALESDMSPDELALDDSARRDSSRKRIRQESSKKSSKLPYEQKMKGPNSDHRRRRILARVEQFDNLK